MEQEFKKQNLCSPYHILIRGESAKYSRECQRINREQSQIARTFKHNERKLKVAQRGVDSLLGHEQYSSCVNQDNILYEHNHPGFCYRRNGEPRRPTSLAESKTRKIVHDMDGKEGLLAELAANVVSDNPVMAEVLSSPEIVTILCDLRTTAALLDNKKLFDQFALALVNNPSTPLPFKAELGEDPLTCLRRYRTNLIAEFFDALQIQSEIRLSRGVPNDVALRYLLSLPKGPDGPLSPLERVFGSEKAPISLQEWNEALLARLREAQHERFRSKFTNFSGEASPETAPTSDPVSPTTTAANLYRQQLRGFGIRGIQSLRTVTPSNYGFRKFKKISAVTIAPLPPPNTKSAHNNTSGAGLVTAESSGLQTPRTSIGGTQNPSMSNTSNRLMHKVKRNKESIKRRYRDEFDSFVKSLISEVENVAEIGNTINELRRKNPARTTPTTRPLVKLLRKKSLFSSLNEDDLIFYEFEGGRQDAEKELAQELNLPGSGPKPTAYMKPGGFTFHVPSRALSVMTIPDDPSSHRQFADDASGSPASDYLRNNSSTASTGGLLHRALTFGKDPSDCCGLRSLKRVCCAACAAKLRQECHAYRDRDRKDQMLTELAAWKTPGNSEFWTKNYTPTGESVKQHLMAGIPISLRKSYNMYSAQPISMAGVRESDVIETRSIMSPQSDGLPSLSSRMDTRMPGQRGAPTPILPRRKFLPGFSTYSSIPHTPPKSQLLRTARIFTKRGNQFKNALSAQVKVDTSESGNTGGGRGSVSGSGASGHHEAFRRRQSRAWTLKVSKLDIMRLRHELDTESIREKIRDFQTTMTRKNEEIHKDMLR